MCIICYGNAVRNAYIKHRMLDMRGGSKTENLLSSGANKKITKVKWFVYTPEVHIGWS